MRLRRRLAIALATTTSLTVAVALVVTVTAFRHGQERQLDHELLLTARQLADSVLRSGEPALGVPRQASGNNGDLDDQVQYVALYKRSGVLLHKSANLGPAPRLETLGSPLESAFPLQGLEFTVRGTVLRGVLVRVDKQVSPDQRFLLLAASRADLDTDTFRLLVRPFTSFLEAPENRYHIHRMIAVAFSEEFPMLPASPETLEAVQAWRCWVQQTETLFDALDREANRFRQEVAQLKARCAVLTREHRATYHEEMFESIVLRILGMELHPMSGDAAKRQLREVDGVLQALEADSARRASAASRSASANLR